MGEKIPLEEAAYRLTVEKQLGQIRAWLIVLTIVVAGSSSWAAHIFGMAVAHILP